ncbi:SDR family oxidoreductase [Oceanidesulfovibrio marinus]|uniref:NAD(P)-dependent oxidoreductase n=1 Tax=Oceanidesulfovibrio marinus TaxID=370038 RepID=A0A6P1ZFW0_9BACT|nr:SDR family oxidoreductase [Oceanidesulfovibrio marinus]TVM33692.1 NAD(P)-dependent oxidoreductase [Oceanidesulfovibrio marinus]
MIIITGASGQLGHLVVSSLLETVPASTIIGLARNTDKAQDLADRGVQVRHVDYDKPETLGPALEGAEKLLLISANEVGRRVPQHQAVIDAAKQAGVSLMAYTSILHADTTPIGLAEEHKATEAYLKASGIPHVLLRNGWYTENYTAQIPGALERGVLLGCAGNGRIASAARADYAAAAAAALTHENQAGSVYELAGDEAYTLADLAAEVARQSGKPFVYKDMPCEAFQAALKEAGLPDGIATMLADSDAAVAKNALFDDGRALSRLIGRPTTPLADMVKAVL